MYNNYIKRLIDVLVSSGTLIILSPILLLISLLVLKNHGRPILFSQKRPGKNEMIFSMYKFRSMTNEMNSEGDLLSDDERLTKFGRTLRQTSLDELPELINIFKGDMSLVGPRPLLIKYLNYYSNEEKTRHNVRPGLTGLAQINGRNLSSWDERLANDVKYVENITFKNDIKIIFKTIKTVLFKENIAIGKSHVMKNLDEERKNIN